MIYNFKIVLNSSNSMTNVSLAMSKIVLLLDEFNEKYKNFIKIVTLSANTKKVSINWGEIVMQVQIKDAKIKSKFLLQLEFLLDTISKNYNVEIKKLIIEE